LEGRRLRDEARRAGEQQSESERRNRDLQDLADNQQAAASEKDREIQSLRDQIARAERPPEGLSSSLRPLLPNDLHIVSYSLAPQTRGVSELAAVSIPSDAKYVSLRLSLDVSEVRSYVAELKSLSNNVVVWRSPKPRRFFDTGGRSANKTIT